jgi:hypothetical protein
MEEKYTAGGMLKVWQLWSHDNVLRVLMAHITIVCKELWISIAKGHLDTMSIFRVGDIWT